MKKIFFIILLLSLNSIKAFEADNKEENKANGIPTMEEMFQVTQGYSNDENLNRKVWTFLKKTETPDHFERFQYRARSNRLTRIRGSRPLEAYEIANIFYRLEKNDEPKNPDIIETKSFVHMLKNCFKRIKKKIS